MNFSTLPAREISPAYAGAVVGSVRRAVQFQAPSSTGNGSFGGVLSNIQHEERAADFFKSHKARLTVLWRALARGWSWGVDPSRDNHPALVSPRGTIFEFRSGHFVRYTP